MLIAPERTLFYYVQCTKVCFDGAGSVSCAIAVRSLRGQEFSVERFYLSGSVGANISALLSVLSGDLVHPEIILYHGVTATRSRGFRDSPWDS